jgi:general secretion pathway protein I
MKLARVRPAQACGFTILEVLAAFVVFAVTLVALLQLFSGGLRDAQLADEYARAVMIAQARLDGYTASERLEEVNATGAEGNFAWSLAAAAYDERQESEGADRSRDYNLRVRLLRVETKVAWRAADGRERDVRLATLVLGTKP